ncbi:hypothetical protein KEM52_005655 [Ascosphaera acerosa]|nr:hypothetical protein KEM52_005655 [Ascosphaera acerosa]
MSTLKRPSAGKLQRPARKARERTQWELDADLDDAPAPRLQLHARAKPASGTVSTAAKPGTARQSDIHARVSAQSGLITARSGGLPTPANTDRSAAAAVTGKIKSIAKPGAVSASSKTCQATTVIQSGAPPATSLARPASSRPRRGAAARAQDRIAQTHAYENGTYEVFDPIETSAAASPQGTTLSKGDAPHITPSTVSKPVQPPVKQLQLPNSGPRQPQPGRSGLTKPAAAAQQQKMAMAAATSDRTHNGRSPEQSNPRDHPTRTDAEGGNVQDSLVNVEPTRTISESVTDAHKAASVKPTAFTLTTKAVSFAAASANISHQPQPEMAKSRTSGTNEKRTDFGQTLAAKLAETALRSVPAGEVDDSITRKVQIIAFGPDGPKNQGTLSEKKTNSAGRGILSARKTQAGPIDLVSTGERMQRHKEDEDGKSWLQRCPDMTANKSAESHKRREAKAASETKLNSLLTNAKPLRGLAEAPSHPERCTKKRVPQPEDEDMCQHAAADTSSDEQSTTLVDHQAITDVFSEISQQLVRQLIREETAIADTLTAYSTGCTQMLDNLARTHQDLFRGYLAKAEPMHARLGAQYEEMRTRIQKSRRTVASQSSLERLGKKVLGKRKRVHERVCKAASQYAVRA